MKTITEIRACLADVRTSLEEQIESDPDVNEARAEHYIECFRLADQVLREEEPLMFLKDKRCGQ